MVNCVGKFIVNDVGAPIFKQCRFTRTQKLNTRYFPLGYFFLFKNGCESKSGVQAKYMND